MDSSINPRLVLLMNLLLTITKTSDVPLRPKFFLIHAILSVAPAFLDVSPDVN